MDLGGDPVVRGGGKDGGQGAEQPLRLNDDVLGKGGVMVKVDDHADVVEVGQQGLHLQWAHDLAKVCDVPLEIGQLYHDLLLLL